MIPAFLTVIFKILGAYMAACEVVALWHSYALISITKPVAAEETEVSVSDVQTCSYACAKTGGWSDYQFSAGSYPCNPDAFTETQATYADTELYVEDNPAFNSKLEFVSIIGSK